MWSGAVGTAEQADTCHTSPLLGDLEQRVTGATSVSTFEVSDIRTYRSHLRQALGELARCSECFAARRLTNGSAPKPRSQHIFDVSHTSSATCATHHDDNTIEACLRGLQSNLSLLFRHHDEFISRSASASRRSESTALEEILYAMLDPTIIPYACSGPFIRLLAKGYVEYSTSKVSSSLSMIGSQSHRELLKQALCAFANRSPQTDLIDLLVSYFRTVLRVEMHTTTKLRKTDILDSIDNYNVDHAERCVELIGYFVRALPDARFEGSAVALLIEAIRDIDGADVLLAKDNRGNQGLKVAKRAVSSSYCSRCRAMNGRRRGLQNIIEPPLSNLKRSAKTTALVNLHDDLYVNDDESYNSEVDSGIVIESNVSNADEGPTTQRVSLTKRMRNFGDEPRVSMKRVMGSVLSSPGTSMLLSDPTECTCLYYVKSLASDGINGSARPSSECELQGRSKKCSTLPLKMIQFRSNTYRALLSLTKYHLYESISCFEKITRSINAVIFNKAIQQIKAHPMCAASRLCAVLIADVRGIENGFLPLLNKLLFISAHSSGGLQNSHCIRVYAELLVNLAVFDDPGVFWKVTKPLLDRAVEMSSHSHEYEATILRAISYIFVERHRTVRTVFAVKKSELHPYITSLSDIFGTQACWIHKSMARDEKDEIICTLQSLGVLGFVEFDTETTTSDLDNCCSASLSGESFPFLPSSSLRDATARMGPHVGCNRFLSRLDARISMGLLRNGYKETHNALRDRADSFEDGTPILEHLKDVFLTRRIFSFLNHRKLAAVSRVCRVWRQIANDPGLWQRLYCLRFKTLLEVDVLPSSTCSKVRLSFTSRENVLDWRKLFDAKWLAERQLRSSFSSCGEWRHKTCDFVGCLAVLKSRTSYEKHISKHKNDLAKQVKRAAVSEERKRRRIAATKENDEKRQRRNKRKTKKREELQSSMVT